MVLFLVIPTSPSLSPQPLILLQNHLHLWYSYHLLCHSWSEAPFKNCIIINIFIITVVYFFLDRDSIRMRHNWVSIVVWISGPSLREKLLLLFLIIVLLFLVLTTCFGGVWIVAVSASFTARVASWIHVVLLRVCWGCCIGDYWDAKLFWHWLSQSGHSKIRVSRGTDRSICCMNECCAISIIRVSILSVRWFEHRRQVLICHRLLHHQWVS